VPKSLDQRHHRWASVIIRLLTKQSIVDTLFHLNQQRVNSISVSLPGLRPIRATVCENKVHPVTIRRKDMFERPYENQFFTVLPDLQVDPSHVALAHHFRRTDTVKGELDWSLG
jgi:hypothetical protein